ncbi:MAG: FecR family protein [Pseudomonadota bacterium]
MKTSKSVIFLIGLIFLLASISSAKEVKSSEDEATVTFLQGKVYVLQKIEAKGALLKVNDILHKEDRINTGEKALIEIKLPDGSFVRFADNTSFMVSDLSYDRKSGDKTFNVKMFLGRTWANAKGFLGKGKSFEISSENAVAGVKGTIYRMDVNKDKGVLVRVYSGNVYVKNPPKEIPKPVFEIGPPKEVTGPKEIQGPREVTLQEWEHIVKEMQQIVITPDGKALEPVSFTQKEDISDWVLWNKERDKLIE